MSNCADLPFLERPVAVRRPRSTAGGDEPRDRRRDVIDERIDLRVLSLRVQHELGIQPGKAESHLVGTSPDHLVSQALERDSGIEIADREPKAIDLAYEWSASAPRPRLLRSCSERR